MSRRMRRRGLTKQSTNEEEDCRYPAVVDAGDTRTENVIFAFRGTKTLSHRCLCALFRHSMLRNTCIWVLVSVIFCGAAVIPVGRWLLGKECSSEGGAIGKWLDKRRLDLYEQREEGSKRQKMIIDDMRFPDVELRANRESQPGYSLFLEVLLSQHALSTNDTQTLPRDSPRAGGEKQHFVPAYLQMDVSFVTVGASSFLRDREKALKACSPTWICQRCLSSPFFGSFELCRNTCPYCYQSLLCSDDTKQARQFFFPRISTLQPVTPYEIPLVLHQSWKEPLVSLHHPELTRLQNTWKTSGLRYHFYTPESANDYVKVHFPIIVFKAYLNLGAIKKAQSEFFRLLVLFREGGIFADVDLLLETNLKSFLETASNLTFLAVLEDSGIDHDHCLWTGLIGATPGHPVLKEAIEQLVGLAFHGIHDKDIFEGLVCKNAKTRLWKFRSTSKNKVMFGSCALGRALNQFLGRVDPFDSLNASHFSDPETEHVYMKILLMSRNDAGATRISDVQHNILVASTSMLGLPSAASVSMSINAPLLRSVAQS